MKDPPRPVSITLAKILRAGVTTTVFLTPRTITAKEVTEVPALSTPKRATKDAANKNPKIAPPTRVLLV